MQSGATGFRVTAIQHLLRARGQSLTADGVYGSVTVSKVKAFQSSRSLLADGVVGPKTWAALVVTVQNGSQRPGRRRGTEGPHRARLLAHGPDGVFGATTASKARAFQTSRGLAADGVVGSNTWQALTA